VPPALGRRRELLGLSAEEEMTKDFMSTRVAVSKERGSESALRRFLARKGNDLFSEIRERSLGLIKSPQSDISAKGFDYFLGPIMSKVGFKSKKEREEFTTIIMGYHNAPAAQFPQITPRIKSLSINTRRIRHPHAQTKLNPFINLLNSALKSQFNLSISYTARCIFFGSCYSESR
jgi:hypothetical protein